MKLFAQWLIKRLKYRQNNSQQHNINTKPGNTKNLKLSSEGTSWKRQINFKKMKATFEKPK